MMLSTFCSRSETSEGMSRRHLDDFALTREAPVVVVGRAGALAGHHAGADRALRRAAGAEDLALPRLDDALEDLTALAGLGVGDADAGDAVGDLGVEVGVGLGELQAALGDEAHPAPLEVRPQLEDLGHDLQRARVALPGHDPGVLVLRLAATLLELHED